MFALSGRQAGTGSAGRYGEAAARRFVLPRHLRRPARFFGKLCNGDIAIPRHTEGAGIAAIFAATALYGSIVGGQFSSAVEGVTTELGFAVNEVEIKGHQNTSEVAVFQALGLDGFTSLVSLNVGEARKALRGLPWVEDVAVRKVYPGKVEVDITERHAYAIWQTGKTLSLIEKDGRVIGAYAGAGFNDLPLVVWPGAAGQAASFIKLLDDYEPIARRMKAVILVGERRWNVRLNNGMTIELPADHPEDALARLMAMEVETGVLERDIASIDLRLDDRTTIALTDNAMTRRDAALKAREKAIKAAKRSSI